MPGSVAPAPLVRRALHRAEQASSLSADEAEALLTCRGADLERLLVCARRVRAAASGDIVSYSRKVFIPLTRLCRDRCTYCTFATTPDHVPDAYLSVDEVVAIARAGAAVGCKEALFTLGDRPEARYPEARAWLEARGYTSTLDYVRAASIAVIEATGLLPHLNPGVMSYEEIARLKPVSASMGLMLETVSERLFTTPGLPHHGSPDKRPAVRLRTIEDAGRLAVPFTTGILIGIGETLTERVESITALRALALAYGHIQEVIVQNFVAKPGTGMATHPDADHDDLLATIAVARLLLPAAVAVQAPPNLSDARFGDLLDAGIADFGGVSPITPDHVNPEKPWPQLQRLADETAAHGLRLRERLTIYPAFVAQGDVYLAPRMRAPTVALADADGFARDGMRPEPMPWQDPDLDYRARSSGIARIEDASVATERIDRGMRDDAAAVYGTGANGGRHASATLRPAHEVAAALARAGDGAMTDQDALALFGAEGPDLDVLVRIADDVRAATNGDVVTYVINRNINFTNVCYVGCRFCAFAQRRTDPDAYFLDNDEVAKRAVEAWADGATEVCIQGGIHPDLPGDHYFAICRAIKAAVPQMHIHAFSPMEVLNGATRLGISFAEWLTEARAAGLGSIPGTAAEILDDEVRWVLTKGKLPAATWEQIIRTAHGLGIRSTATIMYGHVDHPGHWVGHLRAIRRIQEDTGGITEFVPLPFVHQNAPIYLSGHARPGATAAENLRMHAIARLLLHGAIDNIQVSWVKLGIPGAQQMLRAGVNDLGGTLMEETISRMAGARHGIRLEPAQIHEAVREIGRIPARRTTLYDQIEIISPARKESHV